MHSLYSRSVRLQDAIHTLKKCFVIKNLNLCQRVGWNFTRQAHAGVKRCNVTAPLDRSGAYCFCPVRLSAINFDYNYLY